MPDIPHYPKIELEQLPTAAERLGKLLHYLSEGWELKVEGHRYPIAMGEDGNVGYLYHDHIPSPFDVSYLMRLAYYDYK